MKWAEDKSPGIGSFVLKSDQGRFRLVPTGLSFMAVLAGAS